MLFEREEETLVTPLYHLYIACCTPQGGVAHAILFDDGSLKLRETVSVPSPLYLRLSGKTLHTLLIDPFKNGDSGYTTLILSADGSPAAGGKVVSTGGAEACHLSLWNGCVFVANYQSGSVARLAPDGDLLVRSVSSGDATSHPHFAAPSPDGAVLLCTDLGRDVVTACDRDLNPLSSAETPQGSGVRHLVFSPDGRIVYGIGELGNTVTVFSYEAGRLTPLETVDALPFNHPESYAAALRLYDGRLYVSHRGDNSVTVLRTKDNRLSFEKRIPCGGAWPRDFDLFGDFLVCTNEKSDNVTVLRRFGEEWELCSSLALPRPLCVVGTAFTG